MAKGQLGIHSENILPIIKRWLYSDKEIFIRELVSNAQDALQKIKWLGGEGPLEIEITTDTEKNTITIADTGIGMTEEEVKKYIAQIAFSGAEEFMKHYESDKSEDQIIGHFGLGFYSSYMVSDFVEIDTLSHQEGSKAVHWKCDGSSEYEIGDGKRETRGTTITLHLTKEDTEYAQEAKLRPILKQFCSFLPFPISINGNRINEKEPLWVKSPKEVSKEEYLEFYRHLYPMQPDPLFWIHLNVDYPFNLKGILYFPKVQGPVDLDKSTVQLYCNRVFVSDQCQDLLPRYLTALKGMIDSPDIPLNVSRSYLQSDRTVKSVASHISKKVADSLKELYTSDEEQFIACWSDFEPIVKIGAIEDEKFYERAKDFLIYQTAQKEWLTPQKYLEKHKEKTGNKIYYTNEKGPSPLASLYLEKEIDLLVAASHFDTYMIPHLEQKLQPATFQRIDGAADEALLDPSKEKTVVDEQGRTESAYMADSFRKHLADRNVEVEAKSFSSKSLPGMVVVEEGARRLRDYFKSMGKEAPKGKSLFVINTNNPLIEAVSTLEKKDPTLAKDVAEHLLDLTLLSQKEIDPEELNVLISRSHRVLNAFIK